jgi:hypothetical protein
MYPISLFTKGIKVLQPCCISGNIFSIFSFLLDKLLCVAFNAKIDSQTTIGMEVWMVFEYNLGGRSCKYILTRSSSKAIDHFFFKKKLSVALLPYKINTLICSITQKHYLHRHQQLEFITRILPVRKEIYIKRISLTCPASNPSGKRNQHSASSIPFNRLESPPANASLGHRCCYDALELAPLSPARHQ